MDTIEIKPDIMLFLTEQAEREHKPITDILDELLRSRVMVGFLSNNGSLKCHNCRHEIDYEISENKGYCDHCESIVFIEKQ